MILNYLMIALVAGMTGWCLGWSMRAAWDRAIAREYREAAEKRKLGHNVGQPPRFEEVVQLVYEPGRSRENIDAMLRVMNGEVIVDPFRKNPDPPDFDRFPPTMILEWERK